MNKEEYEKMYKFEEEYWWFVGKRFLLDSFLKKYCKNNLKILDVGCGTGITMNTLSKYGDVYGIDASSIAVDFCHKRGIKNIKLARIQALPYSNNEFDIITCLDVLYHKGVQDDTQAIKELYRVLKPNGYLFITDAAMMCLYSRHDRALHGIRRYAKKELKSKLEKAGFKIKKLTYYNILFFPLVYVHRKLSKKPSSDIQKINPILNYILKNLFKVELSLIKLINYPFGVGVFCIAQK